MTKSELLKNYQEESSLILGSSQMVKLAYGLKFALEGHEIPSEFYPLDTTYYLAKQYEGSSPPIWMLALWGGTSLVQLQKSDLYNFGLKFDTWFSEKSLHFPEEIRTSEVLVSTGVIFCSNNQERCTQCGKLMEINSICVPCYNLLFGSKYNIPAKEWAEKLDLKLDNSWIWSDFIVSLKNK